MAASIKEIDSLRQIKLEYFANTVIKSLPWNYNHDFLSMPENLNWSRHFRRIVKYVVFRNCLQFFPSTFFLMILPFFFLENPLHPTAWKKKRNQKKLIQISYAWKFIFIVFFYLNHCSVHINWWQYQRWLKKKFSHSPYRKKGWKKSRMQNNGVINKKGMKFSVSRSHTTTDHNNKRNNAMDCHPHEDNNERRKKCNEKNWFVIKHLLKQIIPKRNSVVL